MSITTFEKHKFLLSFLGEEKVLELYRLFGNERISFATIKSFLEQEKIKSEALNKQSISSTARVCGVHRSTVYRQLKKKPQ